MANTTPNNSQSSPTWAAWVNDLLRELGWAPADLARAMKVGQSTITPWQKGRVPTPSKIREMVEVPEIGKRTSIVDAYMAAGILYPEDLNRRNTFRARSPLSEYSNTELFDEVNRRLVAFGEAQGE